MGAHSTSHRPKLTLGTYAPHWLGGLVALKGAEVATHKHVIGVTGQGKSKLLASMFVQLVKQGVGAALVDPHSDLALDALRLLLDTHFFEQPEAMQRVLYIDFSRRDRFLPFNILNQPFDAHTTARNMAEVCKRAWPALADGSAPQFENILLASVVVLVENQLPLTAMPKLLTDKGYRDSLLRRVSDPYVVEFFQARFDRWGREAPTMIESTLRRVFLLTFSPTLRYSLGQPGNSLDFRQLMDRGIAVIFNLGGLDEDTQRFLGCLITVGFEVAALSRAELPEGSRPPFHLFIDEFSMFSAQSEESLARVLSLARKYGLYLTLAHQTWSQISERLRGALQNTVDIAFKLGRSDAEWAAPRFGHFDPFLVKHEVVDPTSVDRTHPIYFNMQETFETWAQELQGLKPREALVQVGDKTVKIRTLIVPPPKSSRNELLALTERYAELLLKPREELDAMAPPSVKAEYVTLSRTVELVRGEGN